ncbi:MAG TPA: methyltransferase domain-containing protein [Bryobacteraceae bacterium]|nr:methyltransferase domain-containing protein [Bryobacteraceae bacterium]
MPSLSLENPPLAQCALAGLHDAALEFLTGHFPTGSSILDCGAGTGAWAAALAARGYAGVRAVDVCEDAYRAEAPFAALDLNSRFADAVRVAFGPRLYDLITAVEVIEHLESPSQFLRQCRQLVLPAGALLLTSPNPESAPSRLTFLATGRLRHFDRHGDPSHITPLFPSLLARIAPGCGWALDAVVPIPQRRTFACITPWKRALACGAARVFSGHTYGDCNLYLLRPRP